MFKFDDYDRNSRAFYFSWNPLRLSYEMYEFLKRPEIENYKNFFYLDSKGNITTGIGEMIPYTFKGKAEFMGFISHLYTDPACANQATIQQAEELWDELGNLKEQNEGNYQHHAASYYLKKQGKNALYLNKNAIREFTIKFINKKINDMVRMFPNIKHSPFSAQMGVLDVFYNVGAGKVHSEFHLFSQAVREYNWMAAGHHAHRKKMPDARYKAVMNLFMQAALEEFNYASVSGVCTVPYAQPSSQDILFHGAQWPEVCEHP